MFDNKYYEDARAGKLKELRCDRCKYLRKDRYCKKLKHYLENTDAMIWHSAQCGEKR